MIKEKTVDIKIVDRNIHRFKELGYNCNLDDIIPIKIEDLSLNSHVIITAICDICGREKMIGYQSYNNNFSKYNLYTCLKCSHIKNKKTCLEKYNDKKCLQAGAAIENGVVYALRNRQSVPDCGGKTTTVEMAEAIAAALTVKTG